MQSKSIGCAVICGMFNAMDVGAIRHALEQKKKLLKPGIGGLTMAEIENPCFHCYQGAIGECIRCEYGGEYWSGDLGAETIEVDDDNSVKE